MIIKKNKNLFVICSLIILLSLLLPVYAYYQIASHKDGCPLNGPYIGVVFGAAVKGSGKLFGAILYRTQTALKLYREGIIERIIFTGSDIGYFKIGEAPSMQNYAIQHGVPAFHIYLDRNGDNTQSSIHNILHLMQNNQDLKNYQQRILFISQGYHLARIKLLASRHGLKSPALVPALGKKLQKELLFTAREVLAYIQTLLFYWPEKINPSDNPLKL